MINFKKSTGKIGKIKRDYGINLNTIINKKTVLFLDCFFINSDLYWFEK